jgi:hypothetical protein
VGQVSELARSRVPDIHQVFSGGSGDSGGSGGSAGAAATGGTEHFALGMLGASIGVCA